MAANSTSYPLSRGFKASARLNLQHFLHKRDLGFVVHPSVPLDAENMRIADVGTGTGIWLIDLYDEVPKSTKLDGFDVSPLQYPPDEWTPESITLGVLDALEDVPEHLQGKYDVVNIRFFICVIRDNNPRRLIENVFKMLKPGGYFQWTEYDNLSESNETAAGVSPDSWKALKREVEIQTKSDISRFRWLGELTETLKQEGFTEVLMERKQARKSNYAFWQHSAMMVAEEMSFSVPEGEKIRELVQETQVKSPEGVFWNRSHLVFLARKPA